jgi:hypothetical protein
VAKDYSTTIATAQRLITKFGRAITLVEFDTTLADSAKPWDGPADARTAPDSTLALDAVMVQPGGSSQQLGFQVFNEDLVARMNGLFIVSPGAAADLALYQEVIDLDLVRYKIIATEVLRPGPDVIVGFIGVSR